MSKLQAGFARSNITPPMGISISGYYKERYAEGVLDELEVSALALKFGDDALILINADTVGISTPCSIRCRTEIAKVTGVPADHIILAATHTHTGPTGPNLPEAKKPLEAEYTEFFVKRVIDTAVFAMNDLKDAIMGYGKGTAPGVAFIRRYVMKDGSVRTNPGVNNPDIVRPIGATDETVSVLRFDREGADSIVFVEFANHPDVVGGNLISGDWPTLLRHDVEKILDNTKCIFFNGCQGDVNHVNVRPTGGFLNGTFNDFDDVSRGYAHAEYIARVVTGGVLQAFDKVQYVEVDRLAALQRQIFAPASKATPEQLVEAHRIYDLHVAGRDSELPYKGMMLTTVVAEASRMVRWENGPDAFEMTLSGMVIGPVAIIGLPGEPFTGISNGLKATEGYSMIIPCCIANGYEGYFPMQDSYDEGGYEARSSRFAAGVGEYMIEEGKKLLADMGK